MRCLSAPFPVMTRYGITGKFTFDVAELPIRLRWAPISAWGGLERLPEHDETYIYQPMINLMAARVARSQSRARPPAPHQPCYKPHEVLKQALILSFNLRVRAVP